MKNLFVFAMFIFAISIYSYAANLDDFIIHDFNTALKIGEITGKNVVIMFSSKSCYYCKKFKEDVLTDKEIQKWLRTEFIFAEIYADKNKIANFKNKSMNYVELFGAFGIRGTPTFFFFDKEPLAQLPGFVEKDTFLSILKYFKYLKTRNIKYQDFVKSNIKVNIERKILKLKKEDIEYLLLNDPNTKKYNEKMDKYTNVILDKVDKKLEENFYVIIYEK
ncbi:MULTISPECIES: thioredoxin family protein [unclassified Marinitoga]|uniref:thioredoxin family protein n=1 Tax=unclassified Marinitoga TaxID=2640159 RepID=UPI00065A1AB7|nr:MULTISPECIES: thioredoxin fold domain-containing protein [unclassified Marinitoga]KLO21651.1 thioredoxin [Marinitoga sp. 1155]